jgi:hypothetical protein
MLADQDARRAADAQLRHDLRSLTGEDERVRLPHISELELFSPFCRANGPVRSLSGGEGSGSNMFGSAPLELHGRAPSIHEQVRAKAPLLPWYLVCLYAIRYQG